MTDWCACDLIRGCEKERLERMGLPVVGYLRGTCRIYGMPPRMYPYLRGPWWGTALETPSVERLAELGDLGAAESFTAAWASQGAPGPLASYCLRRVRLHFAGAAVEPLALTYWHGMVRHGVYLEDETDDVPRIMLRSPVDPTPYTLPLRRRRAYPQRLEWRRRVREVCAYEVRVLATLTDKLPIDLRAMAGGMMLDPGAAEIRLLVPYHLAETWTSCRILDLRAFPRWRRVLYLIGAEHERETFCSWRSET